MLQFGGYKTDAEKMDGTQRLDIFDSLKPKLQIGDIIMVKRGIDPALLVRPREEPTGDATLLSARPPPHIQL